MADAGVSFIVPGEGGKKKEGSMAEERRVPPVLAACAFRNYDVLVNHAHWLIGRGHGPPAFDPEDLVHDAMVKILDGTDGRRLQLLDETGEADVLARIETMIRRMWEDHRRTVRRRRRRGVEVEAVDPRVLCQCCRKLVAPDGAVLAPEDPVEAAERRAAIRGAFSALAPGDAHLVWRHHVDGIPLSALATAAGVSKSRLSRRARSARVSMRARLVTGPGTRDLFVDGE
jgi:RNA polymerase sigma factor (sigma-70 family)